MYLLKNCSCLIFPDIMVLEAVAISLVNRSREYRAGMKKLLQYEDMIILE
jgi:hypothetical protein